MPNILHCSPGNLPPVRKAPMMSSSLRFRNHTQREVAADLRRNHGVGLFEARRLTKAIDDDDIQLALSVCTEEVRTAYMQVAPENALGDGTLLKTIVEAITKFFQSPEGKALIKALVSLLLGLLVPVV